MADSDDWRAGIGPIDEAELAIQRLIVAAELRRGEMNLGELRRIRGVSQSAVATSLDVTQPNISRIEQEDDVRLSTLGRYIAALGGRLEVTAVFDDTTVPLLRDPPLPRG
jgi:DNA-binding XRE family transcriptional regulator